jgi:membrane-bound lytic murein transglycosylase B
MKFLISFLSFALLALPVFAQQGPQPVQVQIGGGDGLDEFRPNSGGTPGEQASPVSPDVSSYGTPSGRVAPPAFHTQVSFPDWLNDLRQEAIGAGVRPQTVYYALANVYPDSSILEKDRAQPETKMTAQEYWDKLLDDRRIERGKQFYAANRELLRRVSENYGVRSRFIVALLGIESNYGDGQGKESIINALTTLAYDGRRSDYFRGELISALRIMDQQGTKVEQMKGSWAGAMGYCQFMPSSYEKFGQDFDGDGRTDIWTSVPDAAASAANYLSQNGWRLAEGWGEEVELTGPIEPSLVGPKVKQSYATWRKLGVKKLNGKALPKNSQQASLVQPDGPGGRTFLVTNNFHVLLRWNRSTYFAIAVGMLADQLGSN